MAAASHPPASEAAPAIGAAAAGTRAAAALTRAVAALTRAAAEIKVAAGSTRAAVEGRLPPPPRQARPKSRHRCQLPPPRRQMVAMGGAAFLDARNPRESRRTGTAAQELAAPARWQVMRALAWSADTGDRGSVPNWGGGGRRISCRAGGWARYCSRGRCCSVRPWGKYPACKLGSMPYDCVQVAYTIISFRLLCPRNHFVSLACEPEFLAVPVPHAVLLTFSPRIHPFSILLSDFCTASNLLVCPCISLNLTRVIRIRSGRQGTERWALSTREPHLRGRSQVCASCIIPFENEAGRKKSHGVVKGDQVL